MSQQAPTAASIGAERAQRPATEQPRLLNLDAIKGLAIIWVIWGHIYWWMSPQEIAPPHSYLAQYIHAVHMPLFILISGFLARRKPEPRLSASWHYFLDKALRLLLPALLWKLLLTLWQYGQPNLDGWLHNEYWFTPALFSYLALLYLQQLIYMGLCRLLRLRDTPWLDAGTQVLLSVGVLLGARYLLIPEEACSETEGFVLRTLLCLYPYFIIGYLIQRLQLLRYLTLPWVGACSFALLLLSLGVFRHLELEVAYLHYGQFHICRLMALASFALLVYVMSALTERGGRISRWLIQLGQWSLPIYLTHFFFIPALYGFGDYLKLIPMERRLMIELLGYILGSLVTLVPTCIIIWVVKQNPYLDYLLYGEVKRLKHPSTQRN